ncbi:PstS family phosphate ABC transporter substrate-binding protein [Aquibacillus koreensis]|uniref:Phosphate-binding protein n=1 Tax=Aquibacillus koreensis TaxID=279446 RepID=A0A9X3WII9_9BACI|nr:PstS family phosphate ABC transporter substrate-binding protein [Aquibacillus koreensis]MCT2537570.1 PstS family phosphate ABC transporter substrate-binding protein [Aquibacillus koreensis]MDC3419016.1 PstS family phosphate ABC transporter substrate-binding protein [Aquibacillus koreensis]
MKKIKLFTLAALLMLLIGLLAACGTDEETEGNTGNENTNAEEPENTDSENAEEGSEEEASALEGSVVIDGSGTVYPFMAKMADNYMTNEQPEVSVEVGRAGTSAGFEKFLVAESGTDFNDASRTIKDEEAAKAEELGIEHKEFQVALDGITIVINPENDWAEELTVDQVKELFLASSGYKNWSDVDPSFPDQPIVAMGPNENHGTYEFFYEEILEEQDLVDGINLQQDYSTLVQLVSQDKNAVAFFGFGYYDNNQDKVKAINIDFGDGPVAPSLDTIGLTEDFGYMPFTRPVFTYLNVGMAKEKAQVLDYAIYTMENAQDVAAETGFAPLADDKIQESLDFLNGLK